jgi:hypothetical protein
MDRGRNLDELPRAFNPHIPVERSSMTKSIHAAAAALILSLTADSLAHAQSGPTPQEQMACRSDGGKFCAEHIGKPPQMNACLRANKEKLSDGCRKVVESHGG